MFAFTAFFVSSYLVMVADAVPAFDVKQTCRGTETAGVYPGRNMESCVQSEEATRDQLKKSWGEFSAADKTECVSAVKIGGFPSYTELITCLEMRRDVRKMRATSPETTEGNDASSSRRKRR